MKTNTYIDSLVKELSNHLWGASEKERSQYSSIANNSKIPGQVISYKSQYLRDFFEFYIKDLEFTPSQFISALNDNNKLIENLFSGYNAYISDRREFQDIFMPVIRKDVGLFTKSLKLCLDTHHNIYQNDPNPEISAQIERNTNDFKRLLEIGQEENIFRNIPKDVLYTKNSQYINLMQEKNILSNEAFSEEKLIELFNEAKQSNRGSNFTKLSQYCMFYIKDIVEKFNSSEIFNTWAETHINNKKDQDGKTVIVMLDTQFFDLITKEFNEESQPYQNKFIDQWIDSLSFREKISTLKSSHLGFLKHHPHKIIDYLDKLTDSEKVSLINRGTSDCDFEGSNYDFRGFILRIPISFAPPLQQGEIIEKIIDFRKTPHNPEDIMAEKAFFSVALNFLVNKSLANIKGLDVSDEEKAQAKQNILEIYAKNSDIIVSMIHNSENAIQCNIKRLETNIKELKLYTKELNLSSQFFDDLNSVASSNLEMYYSKQADESEYNYMTNLVMGLRNCASVASALGIYSTLDKFNILDITINKKIRVPETKKHKTLYEYPAIFDILETNQDKGLIAWILQEKHLPALQKSVLYKNKNIIEYFSTFDDAKKLGQSPIVEKFFEVMMDNKTMLQELVLSNKKTMKVVKELKNDYIQTSLNVAALDNVLKTKNEEPVKRISRKI